MKYISSFLRTTFTDNRLNQRISFVLGAQFAALAVCSRFNNLSNWRTKILSKAGIDFSETVESILNNLERKIQQQLDK